jgi:hypothetical protein
MSESAFAFERQRLLDVRFLRDTLLFTPPAAETK